MFLRSFSAPVFHPNISRSAAQDAGYECGVGGKTSDVRGYDDGDVFHLLLFLVSLLDLSVIDLFVVFPALLLIADLICPCAGGF